MTGEDSVGLFSSCLPGWDARRVVDVARTLRFTVVEWGAGPGQALEPGQDGSAVRELCAAAGLSVSGVSVQDPEVSAATPRRALPYVRLAVALSACFIRLFAPPYRGGSLAREQRRARAGVDAVVERAAADGVTVLIETSPETLAPTADLTAALVEHHAPRRAGVLFDPGNTVIEGYVAPELAIARLGPHLHHVHVKNIAWRRRGGAWSWGYASLTDGIVAWPDILAALADADYRGGFSIDHLSGRLTAGNLRGEVERLRALVSEATRPRKEREPSPASV